MSLLNHGLLLIYWNCLPNRDENRHLINQRHQQFWISSFWRMWQDSCYCDYIFHCRHYEIRDHFWGRTKQIIINIEWFLTSSSKKRKKKKIFILCVKAIHWSKSNHLNDTEQSTKSGHKAHEMRNQVWR